MIFVLKPPMNIIQFGLIISVFVVEGILSSCNENNQVESFCGSYCFKSILPILDHTKLMNEEVHKCNNIQKTNIFNKVDNIEVQLQSNLEEKHKKIDSVISQIHSKLKVIGKRFKEVDTLEEKISQHLTDHYELIEIAFNKTISSIIKRSDSLEKQLDRSLDSLTNCRNRRDSLFKQIGGKYYYIEHEKRVNWFVAAQTCLTLGSHLVSFQNEEEFNAVKEHLKFNEDYWIGLNDLGAKGDYRSISTGLNANYIKWDVGEPNNYENQDERCVELWRFGHLMNDENCNTHNHAFICKFVN